MKRIYLSLAAGLAVFSFAALAQETQPAPAKTEETKPAAKIIGAAEADKYIDQSVIVTARVAQVSIREKLVYMNLDKKFPDSPLTCVIFSRATNQFGDLKKLQGKQVEIKGKVEEYKNKPQIILNSTNQLKVVEAKAEAPKAEPKSGN